MRARTVVGTAVVHGDGAAVIGLLRRVRRLQPGDHVDGAGGRPGGGVRRCGRLGPAGPRLRQQPGWRSRPSTRPTCAAWPRPGTHEVSGSLSTVPLIVGDTVYLQDGSGRISALDARPPASTRWESEATALHRPVLRRRRGRRQGLRDARLEGCRRPRRRHRPRSSGVKDITATPTTGIDIQPTVYDGLVLVSTVPVSVGGIYKGGDRGVINALDAVTGEVRWTFDTVLGDDLWGQPGGQLRRWCLVPAFDRHRAGPRAGGASPTRRRSPAPRVPQRVESAGRQPLHRLGGRPRRGRPARCGGSTRSTPTTSSTATWSTP